MKKTLSVILSVILIMTFAITSLGLTAIAVQSIKLESDNITLRVGKTQTLKATFTPNDATNQKLTFSSSNKNIATVDSKGNVKGKKIGKTVITVSSASNKKATAKCKVNVVEKITYISYRNASGIVGYPDDGGYGKQIILDALKKVGITGVDYKVVIGFGTEYRNKINILAASNDLPDLFNTDVVTMEKFAKSKLILPLDGYFNNSPNLQKNIRERDLNTCKIKGTLYGLPNGTLPGLINESNAGSVVIRKDWLKNLGLSMPKTLDEYYAVLKAFVEKDPDKNGKDDTYGYGAHQDTAFGLIYNAFGIVPSFWHERDGVLKLGATLPEAKEALAVLRKWYAEKLIDRDFPVMQVKNAEEKFINSRVGVLTEGALNVNTNLPIPTGLKKATPTADMGLVISLKGPKGVDSVAEAVPGTLLRCISAKIKEPDLLMKIIDWSADTSEKGGFMLVTYGVEGKHYTYDKAKDRIKMCSYEELYKAGFSNPVRFMALQDRRWIEDEETLDLLREQNSCANIIRNMFWKTVPAMVDYPDAAGAGGAEVMGCQLWKNYAPKIITGAVKLDAWDEFVQKWYQQGGKVIEEQVNKEWNESKK